MQNTKKRIVLFLGAGASQHMGYKTTAQFCTLLNNDPEFSDDPLWNVIIDSINTLPDIEQVLHILEHIIEISHQNSSELTIGASPDYNLHIPQNPPVQYSFYNIKTNKKDSIKIFTNPKLKIYQEFLENFGIKISKDDFEHANKLIDNAKNLRDKIQIQIIKEYGKPPISTHNMKSFIKYLSNQAIDFTIFTTNYDLALATILTNNNFYIYNGFNDKHIFNSNYESNPNGQKLITYIQLHGSTMWRKMTKTNIIRDDKFHSFSDNLDSTLDHNRQELNKRVMIFPSPHEKSYGNKPFNHYFKIFETKILQSDICIVIGFSFRDYLSRTFSKLKHSNLFIIDKIHDDNSKHFEKYKIQLMKNNARISIKSIFEKNIWLNGFTDNINDYQKFIKWFDQQCEIL